MQYVIGNRTHATRTPEVAAALEEAHAVALAGPIDDASTAFVLPTDADLRAWARSAPSPIAEELERIDESVKKARELEGANPARAMFWQDLVTKGVVSQMQRLAERLGLDLASPQLLELAHEGASVLEPAVLHSVVLWDGLGCASGGICPVVTGVPLPVLSWVGFNDRASSITGLGSTATLWERNWFGGRSAFFFLVGACIDLTSVSFSNIASSALSL
jgi:hypothetical protein